MEEERENSHTRQGVEWRPSGKDLVEIDALQEVLASGNEHAFSDFFCGPHDYPWTRHLDKLIDLAEG